MSRVLHPAALRLFDTPLALLPAHARLLEAALTGQPPPTAFLDGQALDAHQDRTYAVTSGIAVIPVRSCLTNDRYSWWGDTYGAIRASLAAALDDAEVRAIALLIDSPGGEVAGCFDLADVIYAMRGEKPVWAILNENAFSAAYALASACDRIVVPRTGGTGSIGVVTMHVDITRMLDEAGITVTKVQFGARKTDAYPTVKLSDPALARIQSDIDTLGEMFVDTVARNRGIAASRVRDTEAATFLGAQGVEAGLADEVASPDAAFLALLAEIA